MSAERTAQRARRESCRSKCWPRVESIENRLLKAIHAAQLAAVTLGKIAK